MKRIAALLLLLSCKAQAQHVFTYLADYQQVAYYGFADSAGNTLTTGKYNLIARPSEGICRVWAGQRSSTDYENIRYGYCLPTGVEFVSPQYTKAEDFSGGLAAVATGNYSLGYRWGYLDTKGQEQIPLKYRHARSFSEGLAAVATADKNWMYIDASGRVKIPGPFLDAESFSEGLAVVSVPHDLGGGVMSFKKGYIDRTGKVVIQPAYNYCMPFKDGRAIVAFSENTASGYKSFQALIDRSGKRLTKEEFIRIYEYPTDGLYPVKLSGSSGLNSDGDVWSAIDANGTLIKARFPHQPNFGEGLAAFRKDTLWGFMDRNGTVVIPPQYRNAFAFREGLAMVTLTNGLSGYIDKKGTMVIKAEYHSAGSFYNGLAVVSKGKFGSKDRLHGAIDKKGRIVIPMQTRGLGDFRDGKAIAESQYIGYYVYQDGSQSLACDPATLANGRYALLAIGRNDIAGAFQTLKKESGKNCAMIDYWYAYLLLQAPPPMRDSVLGARLMEQAARQGYRDALYGVAFVYLNGLGGKKDEALAREWMAKAIRAGVPAAATLMGTTYETGDPKKAADYYLQAADLGEPIAMYRLALLYRDGKGVAKNDNQFNQWLERSAKRNYEPARQLQRASIKK